MKVFLKKTLIQYVKQHGQRQFKFLISQLQELLSSETTCPIETKLDWNDVWKVNGTPVLP